MDLIQWHRPQPLPVVPPRNDYSRGFVSGALTEPGGAAGTFLNIALALSDATTGSGETESNKVLVNDGKINGTFPSGMGAGNYIIDIDDPSDSLIHAGVTFNPTSLAITSRFLGVTGSGDYPESRVEDASSGFLYWLLGFTYFDGDGLFQVRNARVGNIDFAFTYGTVNLRPALLPVDSGPGWIDLDAIFPPP